MNGPSFAVFFFFFFFPCHPRCQKKPSRTTTTEKGAGSVVRFYVLTRMMFLSASAPTKGMAKGIKIPLTLIRTLKRYRLLKQMQTTNCGSAFVMIIGAQDLFLTPKIQACECRPDLANLVSRPADGESHPSKSIIFALGDCNEDLAWSTRNTPLSTPLPSAPAKFPEAAHESRKSPLVNKQHGLFLKA